MIRPAEASLTDQQRAVRALSKYGWSRPHANQQIGRIKRIFGWAVTKGFIPVHVHEAMLRLDGLRVGRTIARETAKVRPVAKDRALAILPHVTPQIAAMIKLQIFTGMRSTEICILRPCDIDRTSKPWRYRPMFHKTQHSGIDREIPIGPKARKVLRPFLKRDPQAFCFSPKEANEHRRKMAHQLRDYPRKSSAPRTPGGASVHASGRGTPKCPTTRR
jgi:integrase